MDEYDRTIKTRCLMSVFDHIFGSHYVDTL